MRVKGGGNLWSWEFRDGNGQGALFLFFFIFCEGLLFMVYVCIFWVSCMAIYLFFYPRRRGIFNERGHGTDRIRRKLRVVISLLFSFDKECVITVSLWHVRYDLHTRYD